ncbi:hypothetical protein B0H13DRAFT_2279319 [Mycena leptocephala]|nr:hypothetical protein B0H13DRAFT_2279319 [Mycena leptocephala]
MSSPSSLRRVEFPSCRYRQYYHSIRERRTPSFSAFPPIQASPTGTLHEDRQQRPRASKAGAGYQSESDKEPPTSRCIHPRGVFIRIVGPFSLLCVASRIEACHALIPTPTREGLGGTGTQHNRGMRELGVVEVAINEDVEEAKAERGRRKGKLGVGQGRGRVFVFVFVFNPRRASRGQVFQTGPQTQTNTADPVPRRSTLNVCGDLKFAPRASAQQQGEAKRWIVTRHACMRRRGETWCQCALAVGPRTAKGGRWNLKMAMGTRTQAGGEGVWFGVVWSALCGVHRVTICGDASGALVLIHSSAQAQASAQGSSTQMGLSTAFGIESSTFTHSRIDLCNDTNFDALQGYRRRFDEGAVHKSPTANEVDLFRLHPGVDENRRASESQEYKSTELPRIPFLVDVVSR